MWWLRWMLKSIFCWKICLQVSLNLLAYTIFWDKISLIYSWQNSQSRYSSRESFFQQPQNSPKPSLINYHVLQWVLLDFLYTEFPFFSKYACVWCLLPNSLILASFDHDSNCSFMTLVDFSGSSGLPSGFLLWKDANNLLDCILFQVFGSK